MDSSVEEGTMVETEQTERMHRKWSVFKAEKEKTKGCSSRGNTENSFKAFVGMACKNPPPLACRFESKSMDNLSNDFSLGRYSTNFPKSRSVV
jgi:hypothetical protein